MISVVIISYNTCEHLRACLETVVRETPAEIIVVDNASQDGSVAMVQSQFPGVTLYTNTDNPGYGAAANQAIARSGSPSILLLNSDTRLLPGALQTLWAYLDQHPQAAIVGPRLLNPDGSLQPSCYPFPTPLHVFLEESTLGRLGRGIPILKNHYLRIWTHTHDRVVPWLLGAALLIRRSAFLSVGGFEESFFMYSEETDLCYRLRKAGWETHFTPQATIVHFGGASTRQQPYMAVQYFTSLLNFHRRHSPPLRFQQTIWIMKWIGFARWIRHSVRYALISDPLQRSQIAAEIAEWKLILRYPK